MNPSNDQDFRSMDGVDLAALGEKPHFDLAVIGSGPAGQKAAIVASKYGARVALIEKDPLAGGVCLNTGTIPSKSLREAVLYLTGYRQRGFYGEKYRLKDKVQTGDLADRTNFVVQLERENINYELVRNGVHRVVGTGRVTGPHEVTVETGDIHTPIRAENILVAVGTKPRTPAEIPFDDMNVFDSDHVFGRGNELRPLPDSLIVLGAGVIGIEYASIFAALDIPITLVDPREEPLSFVDREVSRILYTHLERSNVRLMFNDIYEAVEIVGKAGDPTSRTRVRLKSGETIEADALLFALGRVPATEHLGVREVGVELDKRNHILVNEYYQTAVPSIYAAGDVIGFPALASTSAEQGRLAALHTLGQKKVCQNELLPFGIYTIPEMSLTGKTEQELVEEGVEYFKGTALFRETARGKIIGDMNGALKLLFCKKDNCLLGVHIIGEGATELLHIGQAVMRFGGGPDYFTETVFNYPTLAEAYKIAAFNALNRLRGKAYHTAPLSEQVAEGFVSREFLKFS